MYWTSKASILTSALLLSGGVVDARTVNWYRERNCRPGQVVQTPNVGTGYCIHHPAGFLPDSVLFQGIAPYEIGVAFERENNNDCGKEIDATYGLSSCIDTLGLRLYISGVRIVSCNADPVGFGMQFCGKKARRELEGSAANNVRDVDEETTCSSNAGEATCDGVAQDLDHKVRLGGHWFRLDKGVPADVQEAYKEMWDAEGDVAYEDIPDHILAYEDFDYVPEEEEE